MKNKWFVLSRAIRHMPPYGRIFFVFVLPGLVGLWFRPIEISIKILISVALFGVLVIVLQDGWWAFRDFIEKEEHEVLIKVYRRLSERGEDWRRRKRKQK